MYPREESFETCLWTVGDRVRQIQGGSSLLIASKAPQETGLVHLVISHVLFCAQRIVDLIALIQMRNCLGIYFLLTAAKDGNAHTRSGHQRLIVQFGCEAERLIEILKGGLIIAFIPVGTTEQQ